VPIGKGDYNRQRIVKLLVEAVFDGDSGEGVDWKP
jgi:hypothetical protein